MIELHIYAQGNPHDEVYIVGTYEALTNLRDLIRIALSDEGCQSKGEFFCADGESYQTHIKVMEHSDLVNKELPYAGEVKPRQTFLSPNGGISSRKADG